jgi:hypothetical protein
MGVGGHVLADLLPGKRPGTQCRRGDQPGQVHKISSPPGFDPQTVQTVASHYTDYAILAHIFAQNLLNKN